VAGAAAIYGNRVSGRTQREGGIITGYNALTDQLQEERKEIRAEARTELAALRAELAAERAESARLRLIITQLGGSP
jgi:hypothetical protein